jgi:hypothetical protein
MGVTAYGRSAALTLLLEERFLGLAAQAKIMLRFAPVSALSPITNHQSPITFHQSSGKPVSRCA